MRERLMTYETLCTEAADSDRARGYDGVDPSILRQLRRLEPTVKRILNRLASDLADFNLEGMAGALEARGSVQRGLGILEDQYEWQIRLAPDAPSLSADRLHPWIWDAARTLWESQHYRAAVHRGASAINANLQDKLQRLDLADDKLVQEAFSDKTPEPGKPGSGSLAIQPTKPLRADSVVRSSSASGSSSPSATPPHTRPTSGPSKKPWSSWPHSASSRD